MSKDILSREERFIPNAKTKPRMRQLFNAIPSAGLCIYTLCILQKLWLLQFLLSFDCECREAADFFHRLLKVSENCNFCF